MSCTPITIESAEFCDSREDEAAGLKDLISIWLNQDVQSYPTAYKTAADVPNGITAMMADVRAASAIVMKAGKFPIKLPCILEKNAFSVKGSGRGSFMTEVKLRIQNTAHNRGFFKNLRGASFTLGVAEIDGDYQIVGQSDGQSTGFLAKVKPDSYDENYGEALSDDKYIEFTVEAKPYRPVTYPFPITYS